MAESLNQKLIGDEFDPKNSQQSLQDNNNRQTTSTLIKIFVFEILGTALFAHGINSSEGNDFVIAAALFIGIFFSCKLSGGHLNPAVSTSFLTLAPRSEDELSQAIDLGTWVVYVAGQLIGAFLGGFLAEFIIGSSIAPWVKGEETDWILADMTGEMIGTFTFTLVILIMTDSRCQYTTQTIFIIGTIAMALFFSRQFTPHSGGCLNPAIALGLEFMKYFSTGKGKYLRRSYIYIIGPISGAVASGIFFRYYWLPKFGEFQIMAKLRSEQQEQQKQNITANDEASQQEEY